MAHLIEPSQCKLITPRDRERSKWCWRMDSESQTFITQTNCIIIVVCVDTLARYIYRCIHIFPHDRSGVHEFSFDTESNLENIWTKKEEKTTTLDVCCSTTEVSFYYYCWAKCRKNKTNYNASPESEKSCLLSPQRPQKKSKFRNQCTQQIITGNRDSNFAIRYWLVCAEILFWFLVFMKQWP